MPDLKTVTSQPHAASRQHDQIGSNHETSKLTRASPSDRSPEASETLSEEAPMRMEALPPPVPMGGLMPKELEAFDVESDELGRGRDLDAEETGLMAGSPSNMNALEDGLSALQLGGHEPSMNRPLQSSTRNWGNLSQLGNIRSDFVEYSSGDVSVQIDRAHMAKLGEATQGGQLSQREYAVEKVTGKDFSNGWQKLEAQPESAEAKVYQQLADAFGFVAFP